MEKRCSPLLCGLLALLTLAANLGFSRTQAPSVPKTRWTIMHYGATDNNNDEMIVPFYQKMKSGFIDNQGLELIALADRNPGYSHDTTVFGEDFSDTRLYRITHEKTERLGGGAEFPEITKTSNYEANTADAMTLKKFIRFCKAHYPAEHYALVVFAHGSGPHMCYDEGSEGDAMYTAEITDVLTAEDSVDIMVLDVCLMGGVENAYQWRPGKDKFGADILVASAPSSGPFAYDKVFERLRSGGGDNGEEDTMAGGKEKYCDPATMTALDFGGVIIEEIYDGQPEESWACYDLTKVEAVKQKVDAFAASLAKEGEKDDLAYIRGSGVVLRTLNYLSGEGPDLSWILSPYFDLYDLAKQTAESPRFSGAIRRDAETLMKAVDELVAYSYGGGNYPGFENGRHGIHIFFPSGDRMAPYLNVRHWALQTWYNPSKVTKAPEGLVPKDLDLPKEVSLLFAATYGHYLWCSDGATPGNDKVENWFELLDSWFDTGNGKEGGLNKCRW